MASDNPDPVGGKVEAVAGAVGVKLGGGLAGSAAAIPGINPAAAAMLLQLQKSADATSDAMLRFNGIAPELTTNITNILEAFNPLKFGNSFAALIGSLNTQISKYQSLNQEFIKLGRGADSKQYIESIRQQSFESMKLGISLDTLINVNKELINSYTGATLILKRQTEEFKNNQKQITELVAFNDKFGVSQAETTKILNLFNTTMEGGSRGAQKLSDNLMIFAERTGQGPGKIFQEFNANMDRFATMTADRAVASFQKLELAAARTGGSVSNIVSAVERFDDIEQGFSYGGQLNRVLSFMGGSFDTFKAMQASDEERAQMLYQAIAQTGDRFQQLQSEGAKRQMAKQIAQSSGLDIKTVVGLLNKSTNLATDMKELSMRPPVTQEFTAEGREQAAMAATTSEELFKIQTALFDLNPLVTHLSDIMQVETERTTKFFAVGARELDKSFRVAVKNAESADGILDAAKSYLLEIKNVPNAFKQGAEEFNKNVRDPLAGVLTNQTTIMPNLVNAINTINNNAARKIEVDVKVSAPSQAPASATSRVFTAADAVGGLPMSNPPPYTPVSPPPR